MKQSFNIQATGAAFDTLSSRLYSNPILAVVRELSTNANDAHIEAGVDKPFQLHIPTDNEPFFYIRDYGNGIPEDLIYNIYTTFFMSTKTEDENQTGYFGLGSKSPYSLVERYTVTSYCEGRKKVYQMEKSNGLPTVEKVEDTATNEETGLEIRFDYKNAYSSDYRRFMNEAKNFFKGTSFLPVVNFDQDMDWEKFAQERTFYMNDSLKIGDEGYYNFKFSVNVAGVKFDIDPSDIKGHEDEIRTIVKRAGVDAINIMAGKSDVTLTPSRETLHYDSKTIEFIINKFKSAVNQYYNDIKADFENLKYNDMLNLMRNQSWDQELNEMCKKKIENAFHHKSLFCYHSGRGGHVDVHTPTHPSDSYSWRQSNRTYLVDFSGIKTTVKQNVVDNFMAGKTFDDDGKLTSTSFTNVIKNIDKNANYVLLFPKDHKSSLSLAKAKELCGDNVHVIKWADICEVKKTSDGEKRKVGFKTRATMLKTKDTGYRNFWGNNPDLEADEIGLIIEEDDRGYEEQIRILELIEPSYKVAIRPCKESVFKTMKNKGYQTVKEYVAEKCAEHADEIKEELRKVRIQSAITDVFNYGYDEKVFEALNNPKYDELATLSADFAKARELYTKENAEAAVKTAFRKVTGEFDLPDYKFSFRTDFPMIKYVGSLYYGNIEDALDYMLTYAKSEEYAQKKIAQVA